MQGHLDWEELLTHIVDHGVSAGLSRLPPPNISFTFDGSFRDPATRPCAPGILAFGRLDGVLGSEGHPESQMLDGCYLVEERGREVKMLSSSLRVVGTVSINDALHVNPKANTIQIRRVDWAPEQRLLSVMMTDNSVAMWTWSPRHAAYLGHIPCTEFTLRLLQYVPAIHCLVLGTSEGILLLYDVESKARVGVIPATPGSPIQTLISLRGSDFPAVLTASVDRSVHIWDLDRGCVRQRLDTGGCLVAVCQWCRRTSRVFGATQSAQHQVFVWDMLSSSPSATLSGHVRDVASIGFFRDSDSDRVLTLDKACEFRLWDLSNGALGIARQLLVFAADTTSPVTPVDFAIMAGTRNIIVAGRRLARFTFAANVTASNPVASLFQPELLRFFTVLGRSITSWDACSGAKLAVYSTAVPCEATAACWDDRKRQLIIGLADGRVAVVDPESGVSSKASSASDGHPGGVVAVAFHSAACRCVVTAGRDSSIRVYDEQYLHTLLLLRQIRGAVSILASPCALATSAATSQIAVGDTSGLVRVYDFETLALQTEFSTIGAAASPNLSSSHPTARCSTNEGRRSDAEASEHVAFLAFVAGKPLVAAVAGCSVQLWSTYGCTKTEPGTLLSCWTHWHKTPAFVVSANGTTRASGRRRSPTIPPQGPAHASTCPPSEIPSSPATFGPAGARFDRFESKRAETLHARTLRLARSQRAVAQLPRGKPLGKVLASLHPHQKLQLRRCNAERPALVDETERWWEPPSRLIDAGVGRVVSQVLARARALQLGLATASDSDSGSDSDSDAKLTASPADEVGKSAANTARSTHVTGVPEERPTKGAISDHWMHRTLKAQGRATLSGRTRSRRRSSVERRNFPSVLDATVSARPAAVLFFASKATAAEADRRPESRRFAVQETMVPTDFTCAAAVGGGWALDGPHFSTPDVDTTAQGEGHSALPAIRTARDGGALSPASQPGAASAAMNEGASVDALENSSACSSHAVRTMQKHASLAPLPGDGVCSITGTAPLSPQQRLHGNRDTHLVIGSAHGMLLTVDIGPVVAASGEDTVPACSRRLHSPSYNPMGMKSVDGGGHSSRTGRRARICSARAHPVLQIITPVLLKKHEVQHGSSGRRAGTRSATRTAADQPPAVLCVAPVSGSGVDSATIVGFDNGRVVVSGEEGVLLGELDRPTHIDLVESDGNAGSSRCSWQLRVDIDLEVKRRNQLATERIGSLASSLRRPADAASAPRSAGHLSPPGLTFALDSFKATRATPVERFAAQARARPMVAPPSHPAEPKQLNEANPKGISTPPTPRAVAEPVVSWSPAPLPAQDRRQRSQEELKAFRGCVLLPRTSEARLHSHDLAPSARERRAKQLPVVPEDDARTLDLLRVEQTSCQDDDLDSRDALQSPGLRLGSFDRIELQAQISASRAKMPPRPGLLLDAISTLHKLGTFASAAKQAKARTSPGLAVGGRSASSANEHSAHLAFSVAAAKLVQHERGSAAGTPKPMPAHVRLLQSTPERMRAAYRNLCGEHRRLSEMRPGRARQRRETQSISLQRVGGDLAMSPFLQEQTRLAGRRPAGLQRSPSQRPGKGVTATRNDGALASQLRLHKQAQPAPASQSTQMPRPLWPAAVAEGAASATQGSKDPDPAARMPAETKAALLAAARDRNSDPYAVLATIAPRPSVLAAGAVLRAGMDRTLRAREPSMRTLLRHRQNAATTRRARISWPDRHKATTQHNSRCSSKCDGDTVAIPARFGPYSTLEVIRARQLFDTMNTDGSGSVRVAEMLTNPEWRSAYPDDRLESMLNAMDQDNSGDVTLAELLSIMFPLASRGTIGEMIRVTSKHKHVEVRRQQHAGIDHAAVTPAQRAEILAIFAAIDTDGDGKLSISEFQNAFHEQSRTAEAIFGPAVLHSVMSRYDKDDNRALDLAEFTEFISDVWLKPAEAARPLG